MSVESMQELFYKLYSTLSRMLLNVHELPGLCIHLALFPGLKCSSKTTIWQSRAVLSPRHALRPNGIQIHAASLRRNLLPRPRQ